jgi:hypothetical protein
MSSCENSRSEIEEKRRTKNLSHTEYKQEIEEFEKLFGVDFEQDLNWNLDWPQILKCRWAKAHPPQPLQ